MAAVTLVTVDEKGRKAVMSDGKEYDIPAGVNITNKSADGSAKCWHLGDTSSLRVILTVGDSDDNTQFRIRRVTPKGK